MTFNEFASYLSDLEGITSRIKIRDFLANLIAKIDSDETEKASYLLTGLLGPSFKAAPIGIGDKFVARAISSSLGIEIEDVSKMNRDLGDFGSTYKKLKDESATNELDEGPSINEVFDTLFDISQLSGDNSQDEKIEALSNLLSKLNGPAAGFVIRMVLGQLRLGFSEKTIIDSLCVAFGDIKDKKGLVHAYNLAPDIGLLAKAVRQNGSFYVAQNASPILGIPIEPMLAQRLSDTHQIVKKMGEVAIEPKFDGLRAQIHIDKKQKRLWIYTRNLKEISHMFPEAYSLIDYLKGESAIIDSEAVGVSEDIMLDFQTTMKRRRKHDVSLFSEQIPITFQLFDIMMLDGKSLVKETYIKRREFLSNAIDKNDTFKVDEFTTTSNALEIAQKHKSLLEKGLEGAMIKKTNSHYVSGRLGWNWVKIKEEAGKSGKLMDTVDCVIMGYSMGSGKRASLGLGQILVGIKDGDDIKTITKVGTGLSDELLTSLSQELNGISVDQKPDLYKCHKDLYPDVWVRPQLVVEVAADNITKSPKHTAGYAMRFPRLVKLRPDKGVDNITTLSEVKKLIF